MEAEEEEKEEEGMDSNAADAPTTYELISS